MSQWAAANCSSVTESLFGTDSGRISKELVAGLMRNNYGQDFSDANGLVCMTAVAPLAAGGSKAAWSVLGGNRKVVEGLIQACADCTVALNRDVISISKQEQGSRHAYQVRHRP